MVKKSGLKVSENKTELCLFHQHHQINCGLNINGATVHSKTSMNVLGIIFDSKLNWIDQVTLILLTKRTGQYTA